MQKHTTTETPQAADRRPFLARQFAALESVTGATDFLVLLALLEHADARGRCWPSHARIAAHARRSVATVKRALARLEQAGNIKRASRKAGRAIVWIIAPEFRPKSAPKPAAASASATTTTTAKKAATGRRGLITDKQVAYLCHLMREAGVEPFGDDEIRNMTRREYGVAVAAAKRGEAPENPSAAAGEPEPEPETSPAEWDQEYAEQLVRNWREWNRIDAVRKSAAAVASVLKDEPRDKPLDEIAGTEHIVSLQSEYWREAELTSHKRRVEHFRNFFLDVLAPMLAEAGS